MYVAEDDAVVLGSSYVAPNFGGPSRASRKAGAKAGFMVDSARAGPRYVTWPGPHLLRTRR